MNNGQEGDFASRATRQASNMIDRPIIVITDPETTGLRAPGQGSPGSDFETVELLPGDGPPQEVLSPTAPDLAAISNGIGAALGAAGPGIQVISAERAPSREGARRHPPLQKMPDNRGFVPTLLSTSVFFISFAVAVTITLYSVGEGSAPDAAGGAWTWWQDWRHIAAPALGIIAGATVASLFAFFNREYTQPDRVDPQVYGEIRTRLGRLDALLPVLCPESGPAICDHQTQITCQASCNEAWARRDFINDELTSRGTRWVLGSGYIELYRQLHAAEAALYAVQPAEDVAGNAFYDVLRLNGADATIPNAESLRANLLAALPLLGITGLEFLTSPIPPQDRLAITAEGSPTDRALGRVLLRDVRQAISEFRDGERANLVRARNQLSWTGTITAIAGYALLTLAILAQAPLEAVMSGVIYYVVGATVGLFNQLNTDRDREVGEDDLGFSRARLFYMPVLSGLAAVGGVMVVALLYEAVTFRAGEPERSLDQMFNVRSFSLGLLIAAVFGLTPSLLVDRLMAKAEDYRQGLTLTSAATGARIRGRNR